MDRYANFCNFSGILFAKYRIPLYIEITKQVHLDHGDVVSRAKDFLKCKFHDLLDPIQTLEETQESPNKSTILLL